VIVARAFACLLAYSLVAALVFGCGSSPSSTKRAPLLPIEAADLNAAAKFGAPWSLDHRSRFEMHSTSVSDLTGSPCGVTPLPTLQGTGVAETFAGRDGSLFLQVTVRSGAEKAERLIRIIRDDAKPGCPVYRSKTPGQHQLNKYLGSFSAPRLGDDQFAYSMKIGYPAEARYDEGGHWLFSHTIMFSRGDRLTIFVLAVGKAIGPGPVVALARREASRF
jgi:hypothetical protein